MSIASDSLLVEEGPFPSSDGTPLYRRTVRPHGDAWARLCLLHGYGDHSARYLPFLHWAAERGVACHTFDFRGHGRAGGRRGFVQQWDEYLDDFAAFLALEAVNPAAASAPPLFLLGHSHGGLVLAAACLNGRLPAVSGCILTSPYFRIKMRVPVSKLWLARAADRVIPWLRVPASVPSEWLSSDQAMLQEDRNDPWGLRTATPRWFLTTQAMQEEVMRRAEAFRLPLLLLTGDADNLADAEAARRFYEQARSADKTFRMIPGGRHELLRETQREQVFEEIYQWMRRRIVP